MSPTADHRDEVDGFVWRPVPWHGHRVHYSGRHPYSYGGPPDPQQQLDDLVSPFPTSGGDPWGSITLK